MDKYKQERKRKVTIGWKNESSGKEGDKRKKTSNSQEKRG
jgi:hypothetical protein